ncbi:MAG: capping complex subunit for YIEGIA [Bhargavaea sp.]
MGEQHATVVAVVMTRQSQVQGGGAPFFIVESREELQKVSLTLEKVMDAAAQEITDDIIIIVAR